MLGTQWLATLGPILWDFGALTMSFWRSGHQVCWHSMAGSGEPWPLFLLRPRPPGSPPRQFRRPVRRAAQAVAAQIPRPQHHSSARSALVVVRPYRYPATHKEELEHQCASMLDQGLIRRSSSTLSSSVLLVKNADGLWRFCVGYRTFNALTVKDAFLFW